MDIYIPTEPYFPYGGALASPWGNCGKSETLYNSQVIPWVKRHFDELRSRVIFYEGNSLGYIIPPATYILGGKQGDYVSTTFDSTHRSTTKRSRREFESAKRSGKIVLSPMLNCRMQSHGTPRLRSENVSESREHPCLYSFYGASKQEARCYSNWFGIPELELDSFSGNHAYRFKVYKDAQVDPISKEQLVEAHKKVLDSLKGIAPDQELITNTVADANSMTYDIATEIGELPETISYIVNGVKEGITLLRRARKDLVKRTTPGYIYKKPKWYRKPRRHKDTIGSGNDLTDASSVWMQYRYAISPIAYSVNDLLDLLSMDAKKFQTFRGRRDLPAPEFDLPGGYKLISSPTVSHRCFIKYRYGTDSSIHQGLKLNLASTAWELVPLSFVMDWFFQVGDYLTAAFTPGVVSDSGCLYSTRVNGQYVWQGPDNSVIKLDVDFYKATPINPKSFLRINSDVFVSYKRAIDAISLSWLLFKKDKK